MSILLAPSMELVPPKSLAFTVTRHKRELVGPAKPTPKESKELSDLDDQDGLRVYIPGLLFYGSDPSMKGRDPVKVIREALAEALVYYYPLAGRLREGPGRKLTLDCTGEGVLFIEADANDVTLEQFGDPLHPPFPCLEELLCPAPSPEEFLSSPVFHFQVTRLKCGGYIFALQLNHTVCDGAGLGQFLIAVGEMARGACVPSVPPVWQRELLNARNPPRVTCIHHEYDEVADIKATLVPRHDMVQQSFFFSHTNVNTLRRLVPPHLEASSTFELIASCMWRCRTIALQIDPDEEVHFACNVNARAKFNPPLPSGYYGNVIASPAAKTLAGKICQNPLGYTLELFRNAKNKVNMEYMRSVTDLMVLKGRRPQFVAVNSYVISDLTRTRLRDVDFGWGKAAYGGPAISGIPEWTSFYTTCRNKKTGQNGFMAPICLPAAAMKRFIVELDIMLEDQQPVIKSAI